MKTPPKAITDFIKSTPEIIKPLVCAQAMIYSAIPFDYSSEDQISPFLDAFMGEGGENAELCIQFWTVGRNIGHHVT